MSNTQTQVSAANNSTPSASNSVSHLVSVQDPDGGYFMHIDALPQLMMAVNSSNSDDAKEITEEARERYDFLEAMLPATPLIPENLDEIFTDYDDCKSLLEIPSDMRKSLVENFKKRRRDWQNIDDLDKEGREIIEDIIRVHRDRIAHSKKMQQVRSNIRI